MRGAEHSPAAVAKTLLTTCSGRRNRNKVLNEARSYENQVLAKAGADASSRTNFAEYQRVSLVNDVSSRADQFQQLLPKYRQNPSLFVEQRLTETLGRVFTNAQDKIFLAGTTDGKARQLRLLLNREIQRKPEEQKP